MLAALCISLAAPEALARPGSQNMQDLHFLARQVAACYAEGKMAFGPPASQPEAEEDTMPAETT
jgi:hypothetical protein